MSGQEVRVAYDGDGALSGSSETGARENSLAAGFAHHLAKPVDLEVVNRLLAARCGPFVHDDAGGV